MLSSRRVIAYGGQGSERVREWVGGWSVAVESE